MAHIYRERRGAQEDAYLRRLVDADDGSAAAGECAPPMDVLETTAGIELVVDLPGVPRSAINVVFAQGALIVAGRKRPASCTDGEAAFHLVERNFGRFARAVHVKGAFDTGKATATLEAGELRIFLPRIEERRGRDRRIEIASS